MSDAPATREIGGNTFSVGPLLGFRTWELQADILPPLAAAFSEVAAAGISTFADLDVRAIGRAAESFFRSMPREKFGAVTSELLSTTLMDGKPLFVNGKATGFDLLMRGRTMDAWRVLLFAVEVNYPDFFGALGAFAARAGKENRSATLNT